MKNEDDEKPVSFGEEEVVIEALKKNKVATDLTCQIDLIEKLEKKRDFEHQAILVGKALAEKLRIPINLAEELESVDTRSEKSEIKPFDELKHIKVKDLETTKLEDVLNQHQSKQTLFINKKGAHPTQVYELQFDSIDSSANAIQDLLTLASNLLTKAQNFNLESENGEISSEIKLLLSKIQENISGLEINDENESLRRSIKSDRRILRISSNEFHNLMEVAGKISDLIGNSKIDAKVLKQIIEKIQLLKEFLEKIPEGYSEWNAWSIKDTAEVMRIDLNQKLANSFAPGLRSEDYIKKLAGYASTLIDQDFKIPVTGGLLHKDLKTQKRVNSKKFVPEVLIPNDKKLLEFLNANLKYCNHEKLHEKSMNLSGVTKEFNSKILKSVSPIVCQNCLVLIVPIELECGHSMFICCFIKKVKKLRSDTNLELLLKYFRKCSCNQCHKNFTTRDISKYANSEFQVEMLQLKLECKRCKQELPLMTHYWTEPPCLDLCANCYINLVHKKNSRCPYCHLAYTNKTESNSRTGTCSLCQKIFSIIPYCRISLQGHILCVKCLNIQEENSIERKQFPPVSCSECYIKSSYFSIFTTQCCNKPVCQDCNQIVCSVCNQIVTDILTQTNSCCFSTILAKPFKCTHCIPNIY